MTRRAADAPPFADPRRPAMRAALVIAVLGAAALGIAGAGATPRSHAPRIAAYTVINGTEIASPLAGLIGDPVRGEAVFADPMAGGCVSCHAYARRGASRQTPEVVLAALAPPAPADAGSGPDAAEADAPEADAAALGAAAEAEPGARSGADGPAPLIAPLPIPRGAPDAAEAETETEAAAEEAADDPAAPDEPEPDMTLAIGPPLDDAGARLGAGRIRLWIVDPTLAGGTGMPAYHGVDFELAARAPDLRQPWLAAQQIEDIVAFLMDPPPPVRAGR